MNITEIKAYNYFDVKTQEIQTKNLSCVGRALRALGLWYSETRISNVAMSAHKAALDNTFKGDAQSLLKVIQIAQNHNKFETHIRYDIVNVGGQLKINEIHDTQTGLHIYKIYKGLSFCKTDLEGNIYNDITEEITLQVKDMMKSFKMKSMHFDTPRQQEKADGWDKTEEDENFRYRLSDDSQKISESFVHTIINKSMVRHT